MSDLLEVATAWQLYTVALDCARRNMTHETLRMLVDQKNALVDAVNRATLATLKAAHRGAEARAKARVARARP